MSFTETFPELRSGPPTMAGAQPLPATVLTALRRQQLVDLARAYEVAIPAGTKQQILPPMITAEQQGVFRQQPKHLWYLHKAARTSDIPYQDIGENPELAKAERPVERASAPRLARTERPENDYRRKQRLLKEAGVHGAFGITKQAMDELAAEHGIS